MKKYRIVFFNPVTSNKRVYHFTVTWDSSNHGWNIHIKHDLFGYENDIIIRYDYRMFINMFADNDRRRDEYITIKEC